MQKVERSDLPPVLAGPDHPPDPVCEVCARNPVTVVVTDHANGVKHQYCDGCYFILHPTRSEVEWP